MSSLTVQQQVFIDFEVNGTPIPVGLGSFHSLSIVENTNTKAPTIEFVFKDPDNSLHDLSQLVDGSKIGIVLHSNNGFDIEGPYQITFLCVGSNAKIAGGSLLFKSAGIFNCAKFLGGVVKGGFSGTSTDVVGKLAGQCGLNLKNPVQGVSDKMVWMPSRETYCDFIRNIVGHGYSGEKSIMSTAVSTKGELFYKDISKLAGQRGRLVINGAPNLVSKGVIPMVGYEILDMSGLSNFMYNYGSKLVQEKMDGSAQDFLKSAISMGSNFLSINTGIRDAIGGIARSEYLPHDMGNQHKKYYEAEYQNKKGKGTFTNRVEFTTTCATGLSLYDTFDFQPTLPTNNKISDLWSGSYIVTAKTKFLGNGGQYFEKVRGVSQGYGTNFGGSLLGAT